MTDENRDREQIESKWFIDLDWYDKNERYFPALAQDCLCPKCHKRIDKGELSSADLMTNIRDCCSHTPGFISDELTILEVIFRLLLAGGNEPISLTELSKRLAGLLEGSSCRASAEVLSRLLEDEDYYGIRRCLA